MKIKSYILLFLLLIPKLVLAQDNANIVSDKDFSFVYIAHEAADPVNIISSRLREMKDDAEQYGNVCIFYLANNNNPLIFKCNLSDDSNIDFNDLVGELNNTVSHSVDPMTDVNKILELLDQHDVVNELGQPLYSSITFDFYVGADFWTLGYNESIIAKLYFLLDVPSMKKYDFVFRVNAFKDNYPKFEEGKPYGDKNLMGINKELILQYIN